MKSYIGTKIIQAEPMTNKQMHEKINPGEPWTEYHKPKDGYKVIYPDGYESWSPKEVFENAYREITDGEKELVK